MRSDVDILIGQLRHYAKHPFCSRELNRVCANAAIALVKLRSQRDQARTALRVAEVAASFEALEAESRS